MPLADISAWFKHGVGDAVALREGKWEWLPLWQRPDGMEGLWVGQGSTDGGAHMVTALTVPSGR